MLVYAYAGIFGIGVINAILQLFTYYRTTLSLFLIFFSLFCFLLLFVIVAMNQWTDILLTYRYLYFVVFFFHGELKFS